jgi:ABC-type amino acid transport substrate-binding protein
MIFSGNEEEWLDFINVTLTKMKETGEYDKVLDRWFGPEAGALRRLFEPEK